MAEVNYRNLYDEEKKKVSVLEQKLAVYENDDLEREGYYALKYWVKQQIDIVKDFQLSEEIKKNPKEDKYYDRVKALGEDMKKMISDLNTLRSELKISQKEDREDSLKKRRITTPETIADDLGNTAGQLS